MVDVPDTLTDQAVAASVIPTSAASPATGESLTTAVATAVRERLERLRASSGRDLAGELTAIALRCASLPVLDDRPQDEVLGHDEHGLPS